MEAEGWSGMVHLGQRIRQGREMRGWTQQQLGERAGVSQRVVSYVEAQAWLRLGTLERYAQALGLPLSFFLSPRGEAEPEAAGPRLHDWARAIEEAFAVVCRDAEFGFGARQSSGERLSFETKRDIVRLYERLKGVKLLPDGLY